jgi:anti-anti-sigma factor
LSRPTVLEWLAGYRKEWLRPDVMAGLTIAAVVIPKAMAYATIAGLPVEIGLYTALVPMIIYAALGQVASAGDPASLVRATATLSLLVGVVLVAASALRLGFVANFISEPVLVGFEAGIGLVIVLDQVPKLLGVHFPKTGFLRNIVATIQAAPETSLPTLAVGVLTIATLVAMEHFTPRLPAPLVAVAAGIALMSFTETIAAGRAFAGPGEPHLRPNRELLATGLANAGGAFVGALPAGGGTSQTAVNRVAGAHTQLSALTTAGATLLTMLFLAGPMGGMPQATLAAVVIVYSVGLIDAASFRAIRAVRVMEFVWALVALAQQAANPPVHVLGRKPGTNVFRPRTPEHPGDETFPGLLLLRVEGRIFFLNAPRIGEKVQPLLEETKPNTIILDMRGVFDLEYTALKALTEAEARMRERGIALWLVGMAPAVLAMVQRSPLGRTLGREGMHFNLEIALNKYLDGARTAPPPLRP